MRLQWALAAGIVCILLARGDRSFVNTAPTGSNLSQGNEEILDSNDSNVLQLESLKHSLGKTLAMIKSQSSLYTNVNGNEETHLNKHEEVSSNGELVAGINQHVDSTSKNGKPETKSRTDLAIPAQGLYKSIIQDDTSNVEQSSELTANGNRRQIPQTQSDLTSELSNNIDKYPYGAGVQYSPLDMAEYVFWTGDEKGVTLAVQEFLQDGLMTRDEAISFLQEIKLNLDYLQAHYSQQGVHFADVQRQQPKPQQMQPFSQETENNSPKSDHLNSFSSHRFKEAKNTKPDYEIPEKKSTLEPLTVKASSTKVASTKPDETITDEEYELLLERLRVADFLYTQYSLEEVIYQLAKVMFSQSLTRGSAEAQEALQKFTTFLEAETEQGHISRSLEKKVLDVLIAALTDTLTEHPELVAAAREGLGGGTTPKLPPGNNMLQQILDITPEEKEAAKSSLYAAFKDQKNGHQSHDQKTHTERINSSNPLQFGKYKIR